MFLQTVVMNLLRRGGYRSIRQGFLELADNIKRILALGRFSSRQQSLNDFQAALRQGDLALSLELATNLAIKSILVGSNGQQEIDPLLQASAKNACVVCSASGWIRKLLRSSLLNSSLGAAFSLDS